MIQLKQKRSLCVKEILSDSRSDNPDFQSSFKLSFLFIFIPSIIGMAFQFEGCPYPVGLCKYYDFNVLFTGIGSYFLVSAVVVFSILYMLNIYSFASTGILTILTAVIISHHESNGVYYRATAFTIIWLALFISQAKHKYNPNFNVQKGSYMYVIQVIAAMYLLAAYSKLSGTGFNWPVVAAKYFPLQILKNYSYSFFDTLDSSYLDMGYNLAYNVIDKKVLITVLLSLALFLELSVIVVCFHPVLILPYGIALLMMHLGISYFMNIYIAPLADPMVVFFINPLFYIRMGASNLWGRIGK